jgi:hypothetical protein
VLKGVLVLISELRGCRCARLILILRQRSELTVVKVWGEVSLGVGKCTWQYKRILTFSGDATEFSFYHES